MYACQSNCLNDADRHHQHVKEEKWSWWCSSAIIDLQLFSVDFDEDCPRHTHARAYTMSDGHRFISVTPFAHLRSSTFVRSSITYFRIRRKESIKTDFSSRFGIDTQGRAWSTDLRISINRSLIGSFRRWNSNDPVSGLTCPYTRSSFWLAAAAQETIVSIEFSFNDRSNVIYESKQDEEGEGEGEAERESICVW